MLNKNLKSFENMGKIKLSQSSLKISKKSNDKKQQEQQQQLNTLIEVLRPKVYITDSSNFKTLVQELTGNGTFIDTTIPISPPPTLSIIPFQPLEYNHDNHMVHHEDQDEGYAYAYAYQESSSVDSSELSGAPTSFSTLDCSAELSVPMEPHSTVAYPYDESLWSVHDDQINLSHDDPCRDVHAESWFSEMGYQALPSCYFDGFGAPVIQQEVCVYDYDLSGLI